MTLVDVPKLELRVSRGGHDVLAAEELDVGHSLPVTLEHVQGLLGGPEWGLCIENRHNVQAFKNIVEIWFLMKPKLSKF